MLRSVLRVVAQATTASVVGKVDNSGAAQLAVQLFSLFIAHGDSRTWLTLPRQIELFETSVTEGQHSFELTIGEKTEHVDIDAKPGSITIVWVMKAGLAQKVQTLVLK